MPFVTRAERKTEYMFLNIKLLICCKKIH